MNGAALCAVPTSSLCRPPAHVPQMSYVCRRFAVLVRLGSSISSSNTGSSNAATGAATHPAVGARQPPSTAVWIPSRGPLAAAATAATAATATAAAAATSQAGASSAAPDVHMSPSGEIAGAVPPSSSRNQGSGSSSGSGSGGGSGGSSGSSGVRLSCLPEELLLELLGSEELVVECVSGGGGAGGWVRGVCVCVC